MKPDRSATPALEFSDVSFSYGNVKVLENATFHVHEKEFAALLGPNGSGKTTILRLMLGLARPSSGSIRVQGLKPEQARGIVGYVPQHATYDPAFPVSVLEVVRMGRLSGPLGRFRSADSAIVERALDLAGVKELSNRSYSALSGGQRRRVLVARALAAEPQFLVLDEPSANMDSESERRLYEVLAGIKGTATILVVTHDTGYVSALTDAVLCVGAHADSVRSISRHSAVPTTLAPSDLFGGKALQVRHDVDLSECGCCSPDKTGGAS